MEYRVQLEVYHGPLDLLLYLIKRDELDIYDIPIARITESYMDYLQRMKELGGTGGEFDINVAGEFLVMAATLMEIKSAMLLPRQAEPTADGQPSAAAQLADPRYELVQKLLEYKRFKDSAAALERQQHLHQERFARIPARWGQEADEPPPVDLEEVQVWDLLSAFSRLMKEVGGRRPGVHEVMVDDTPLSLHAADIEDRLSREGKLTLRQLIVGRKNRSEMIGLFLALLELIRQKKILIRQEEDPAANDFEIAPAPEEHRKLAEQMGIHLAEEKPPADAEALS